MRTEERDSRERNGRPIGLRQPLAALLSLYYDDQLPRKQTCIAVPRLDAIIANYGDVVYYSTMTGLDSARLGMHGA